MVEIVFLSELLNKCLLNQVVKAARGQVPVFLDGGIRRGTDVFKALALGASGVFVSKFERKSLSIDLHAEYVLFYLLLLTTDWKASSLCTGSRWGGWCEEGASNASR